MRGVRIVSLLLVCATTVTATGQELEGFRLGMSMDQVRQLAREKGYNFSNGIKSGERWISYVLMRDGPSLSFCDDRLSAISAKHPSSLHEATSVLRDWSNAFGTPDVSVNPTYVQGTQFSTVEFRWSGNDNLRRSVSISQFGTNQMSVGFSYSYILHPCRAS